MTLDDQILETIQQIAGIFLIKNIPTAPVNLDYLEEKVAVGMEPLVIRELIMYLEDLFADSLKEEKRVHRFSRYIESFNTALEDNCNDGNLIGRKKRSA